MIRFACPGCEATYTVPDEKAGKTGKCPKCQAQFVIPTPPPAAAATPSPRFDPTPPPAASTDLEVEIAPCPGCQARLMVATSDLGTDVECPYCKTVYRAETAGARAEGSESRSRRRPAAEVEERPSRRRRDEDDEDERPSRRPRDDFDDEDDFRPRRKRSRRREEAVAAVAGPAIILAVVGGLGVLMGLANVVSAALDVQPFAPAGGPPRAPAPGFRAGQYVGAFVSLLWGIVVLLGGLKMKSLSGRGSAMVGAVVSIIPCNPCCLLGIPVGIWALVVMNRDDVRRAFD